MLCSFATTFFFGKNLSEIQNAKAKKCCSTCSPRAVFAMSSQPSGFTVTQKNEDGGKKRISRAPGKSDGFGPVVRISHAFE